MWKPGMSLAMRPSPSRWLTGAGLRQFYNNRAFERNTLSEAMQYLGLSDLKESICPWISREVTLHAHQLVGIHWMIEKTCGGILGDDYGLAKVKTGPDRA